MARTVEERGHFRLLLLHKLPLICARAAYISYIHLIDCTGGYEVLRWCQTSLILHIVTAYFIHGLLLWRPEQPPNVFLHIL